MQKITPHFWFDKEAKEAAEFYTSIFPDSKVTSVSKIKDTPSGDCDIVSFTLCGQQFESISAGPVFKLNPSISFLVACDTKEDVDKLWNKLSKGGKALMELGEYPFSARYGWLQDKYGVSWQIMFTDKHKAEQKITPTLMFVGKQCGKAEEAMNFYTSIFKNSKVGGIMRYGKGEAPDKEGTIKHAEFILEGQNFEIMDSAHKHEFEFNEAVSFIVDCKDQKEVDYFWDSLMKDGGRPQQCGWLKDRFGVSWQIIPAALGKLMSDPDPMKSERALKAMLDMVKIDVAGLQKAHDGK